MRELKVSLFTKESFSDAQPPKERVPQAEVQNFTSIEEEGGTAKHAGRAKEQKPWLHGPLALSRHSCRYELPMDVRVLERMTPLEYTSQYCRLSSRRRTLFKHYFVKNDRDRDGLLNRRDLHNALRDLYAHSITAEQVKGILETLDIGQKVSSFDWQTFKGVAAFSERYLYHVFRDSILEEEEEGRSILEETDFSALKWKLEGCKISCKMSQVLNML